MGIPEDRRHQPRELFDPLEVGLLIPAPEDNRSENPQAKSLPTRIYVDVLDRSAGGAGVRGRIREAPKGVFYLGVYNSEKHGWDLFAAETAWIRKESGGAEEERLGVRFLDAEAPLELLNPSGTGEIPIPSPQDYQFFRRTQLLKSLSRASVCPLLNNITRVRVKAGERFISQGDSGDMCYLIQRGSCVAEVEKSGALYPVYRHRGGEFVGEMAILTGEPRSANVRAETDMTLWALSRETFETLSKKDPDLRNFLTEIVADRFASAHMTADRRIGKYLITDIVGRGGFSILYKGLHRDLNMQVAVKMLKHDLAMDPDFQKKFREEARLIARFNHENIVRIYDIEERYRTLFIIMEFLDGLSLRELIRDTTGIPFRDTVRILIQACSGLKYAHDQGIVHQDVKPGNLLILPSGRVKVVDFGLACPCGSEVFDFAGTAFYQAPEQIESLPLDPRTDVYALGITAYEMVTGKRPYPEADIDKTWELHLEQEIPDPLEAVPDLPEGLRRFILKACKRMPEERYKDMKEALDDLRPLAAQLGLTEETVSHTEKRKTATLFLIYREGQQKPLTKLMEEFSAKARELGVTVKGADFEDI